MFISLDSGYAVSLKKQALFFLTFLAACCDIPMYSSFIVIGDYSLITYSFHKVESGTRFLCYPG